MDKLPEDVAGLVERLEAWAPLVASGYEVPAASKAIHEAASTIRALVAEIERLRDKRDEMSVEAARLFELHRQAEAKLREAVGMRVVPVEHDPTNPFAPRGRPKKSIRLMTDAERRAAGLDLDGGFDGPTGAE